jgi:hypothetical protein
MQIRIYSGLRYFLCAVLLHFAFSAHARQIEVPVRLEQGFIQRLLAEQVYTETGEAHVWDDGKDCNVLTLSAPESGFENGQVRTKTAAQARIGTAIGSTCIPLLNWNGFIEIFQEPLLGSYPGVVEFQVVDSKIYKEDSESPGVFGTLWDWVKKYVHPRFNRLQLNLQPLLDELRALLGLVFPLEASGPRQIMDSVTFSSVVVDGEHIELGVRFEVPELTTVSEPAEPEPPLTHEELLRWEQAWQRWDAFLTSIIKHAGADTSVHELRTALLAVLLDARQDLLEVLVPTVSDAPDPVPALFVKTWEQLAPELRRISENIPSSSVISYLSFITAGDALAAIQTVEAETGFILTADALRRMARMIAPADAGDPLRYDTEVDPELREVFGFGPPLPPPEENRPSVDSDEQLLNRQFTPESPSIISGGMPGALLLSFMPALIVHESAYQVLVSRLNGWVPTLNVLNEYLPQMHLLLDLVAQSTLQKKHLDSDFRELYRPLVLATAWQESCWRQYIKSRGEIVPIRSHAGAVGIMQINQHVWRGFYDPDGLQHNVGYNAEAGSEILHHYLVDYAVARGEHNHEGGLDNLMRSTYAMYNGGPKHISRYRNEKTSSSLQAIDKGFWEKFQKVKAGNTLAVAQCYTG